MIHLLALLFSLSSFAEVQPVDVSRIAATQAEVGETAVTKMMNFWAEQSGGTPEGFRQYLEQKVVAKAFPGVNGPSLWEAGGTRTYILDGHHRASAYNRILMQDYDALPEAVRKVMSREMQASLRADPAMRFRIDVQRTYASGDELVKDFARNGRGQLPASVRAEPAFSRQLENLRLGQPVDPAPLRRGYASMARSLSELRDSPLRSAVGNAFFQSGIDSDRMIHYIEFHTAEKIEATLRGRGITVTAANAASPEIEREVRKAILGDKKILAFLKEHPRHGEALKNIQMLDAAEARFRAERASFPARLPASCGAGFSLLAQ